MSEELFAAETRSAEASFKTGCIGGLGAVLGIIGAMSAAFLLSGTAMTPSLTITVRFAAPIGLVTACLLGYWAYGVHRASARQLVLTRSTDGLSLTIAPDISLSGELRLVYGWQTVPAGPARTKLFWCDVLRDDKPLLRLSHEVGAVHGAPQGWPEQPAPLERAAELDSFTVTRLVELVQTVEDELGQPEG